MSSRARPVAATPSEVVLLVEDDPQLRRAVARTLRQSGYAVIEAGDAELAARLAVARAGPIDLLLTDVTLPGMNGRELADCLTPSRPEMKVLFMSGHHEDPALAGRVAEGSAAFLAKPFAAAALALKVREVLRTRSGTFTVKR